MMLNETFEERLKWIASDRYERSNGNVIVRETKKDGEAEVLCRASNDVLSINLGEKNRLPYLTQQKVADAVIFEFTDPETVRLHIIECKRKVKTKEWRKIKKQFEGALLNALGMMGVLGLSDIQDIVFYTAYREDKLSPDKRASSVTLRTGVGKRILEPPSDWVTDRISVLSLSSVHHRKIQLDGEGKGEIAL